MTLNYVSLLITEQDAGQGASAGAVTITPTSLVTASGVTQVSQQPLVRQFSGGSVTVSLLACDNAGTTPAAGFWAYQIQLPGQSAPQLYLVNYAAGSSQRLDQLSPVVPLTTYGPAAAGLVTSVNSRTGAVVLGYADVGADQSGAAAAAQSAAQAYALGLQPTSGSPLPAAVGGTSGSYATAALLLAALLAAGGGTMGAALAPKVTTITYAATITPSAAAANAFRVTLAGSPTINVPSGGADGQQVQLELIQDGAGPRTVTWGTGWDWGSAGAPTLSTAAGATDLIVARYSSAAGKWLAASSLGY